MSSGRLRQRAPATVPVRMQDIDEYEPPRQTNGATVDWTLPPLSLHPAQRVLDVLSCPGPSVAELALTTAGLVGAVTYATHQAAPTWTAWQRTVSIVFAVINGSAAVQCATAQSKRWYHADGGLSAGTHAVIAAETAVQCFAVGGVFTDSPLAYGTLLSLWFVACIGALWVVSLHVQRPTAILLFCASTALLSENFLGALPEAPGASWMPYTLAIKYLVSHVPRHEPYYSDRPRAADG
jgi:hypothetical protein